jgi:hypothetical protein
MKTFIVAAYEKELSGFRTAFAAEAARGEVNLEAIGVGAIHAALGAYALRLKLDREIADAGAHVLLVGTAGSYDPSRVAIGSVVTPSSIRLATSHGVVPELAGNELTTNWVPEKGPWVRARVLNTMGITTEPSHTLREQGDVEHMEAYACAAAFAGSKHTLGILLGVTNEVGPMGREQWRANEARVMASGLESVRTWLSSRTDAL